MVSTVLTRQRVFRLFLLAGAALIFGGGGTHRNAFSLPSPTSSYLLPSLSPVAAPCRAIAPLPGALAAAADDPVADDSEDDVDAPEPPLISRRPAIARHLPNSSANEHSAVPPADAGTRRTLRASFRVASPTGSSLIPPQSMGAVPSSPRDP